MSASGLPRGRKLSPEEQAVVERIHRGQQLQAQVQAAGMMIFASAFTATLAFELDLAYLKEQSRAKLAGEELNEDNVVVNIERAVNTADMAKFSALEGLGLIKRKPPEETKDDSNGQPAPEASGSDQHDSAGAILISGR